MGKRAEGAVRLALGLPFYLLASFVVLPILFTASAIVWLADTLWQIGTDSDGLTADNPVAKAYEMYVGGYRYVAYGDTSSSGSGVRKWRRS